MTSHDYITDVTDIQPMIGMSLGSIRDMWEQLVRQYGSDAVLSNLCFDGSYPCVHVEMPIAVPNGLGIVNE